MFHVEMEQDKKCDNNTTCNEYMKNNFPITRENAHGVIPILGTVTSCIAVGMLMEAFNVRGAWFKVWFFAGFVIYIRVQTFWGFHCKNQKFLQLWIVCKGVEVLAAIAGIAIGLLGGPCLGLTFLSIFLLALLVFLLRLGFIKDNNFKKSEKNIYANQCLDQLYITKY